MNVEHLREFVAFCETMNYSRAAKKLFIAQPTLIQHVAKLERELGFPLVTHDGAPRLTETGALFRAEAISVLDALDQAIERCRAREQSTRDSVRIVNVRSCFDPAFFNASPEAGGTAIPVTFIDFNADTTSEFALLDEGHVDFSITFSDLSEPELTFGLNLDDYGFIEQDPLPCFALIARDHPLASLQSIPPSALAGYTVLTSSEEFFRRNSRSLELMLNRFGVRTSFASGPSSSADLLLKSSNNYVGIYHEIAKNYFDTVLFDTEIVTRLIDDESFILRPTVIYRRNNPNPLVHEFAEQWRRFLQERH